MKVHHGQSIYLLHYVLSMGQNESYKKALLNFANFVNVFANNFS